ncbi:hypothetical protein [Bacillus salipaludis]|uniref:hypothetical protein n=1 Tax=Bacillus salipaludis TaxID=2547811 RepID=UPI002E20DC30|nr:hypothetical protein [Bacillus salipaludis]
MKTTLGPFPLAREIEIVKINPQQSVEPVAVFIGEHFDKNQVQPSIQELTNIN